MKFDLFLILSSMLDIALKQVAVASEVLQLDGTGRVVLNTSLLG